MSRNESWGIEVGANAIKAIRLQRIGDEVDVLDYEVLPHKRILTTPDLNVDEAVQVALDQFISRHDVSKSNVVVSVPGHLAFARFARLPPIEPKKIGEIVQYEAMQQIPFPIHEVEWDYQVFQEDDAPDVEVGIFAISKERVANFLNNYRAVGIRIDALTLSPIAVYNALAFDRGMTNDSQGTLILDIGTTSTDLIIVESGRVWLRTMAIGGNNFTEAVVKAFKLSFPKAEKLKKEAGTSKYARQIFQAMRPVFADLVQEIQKSMGFYQQSHRDADLSRMICVGSTFRLPGLQKFLKQQLDIEVIRPDKYEKLEVEGKQASDFAANALNMATAYGCALQGLELERVSANVLPQHIVKQRLWKAKQPWIAAAAAVVLAATGLAWWNLNGTRSSYNAAKQVTETEKQQVIPKAQELKDKLRDNVTLRDPRMQIENLQRVLDYRDVWPKILEDVDLVVAELKPQDVLLEADYDKIKDLPRNMRRRIYIDTVTARYEFGEAPDPSLQYQSVEQPLTRTGADQAWGGGDEQTQRTPPSFTVTIRGTTPYTGQSSSPAKFLTENIIRWLKTHEAKDRPYKIIPSSVSLTNLSPIREEQDATDSTEETPRDPRQPVVPPSGNRVVPPPSGKIVPADPRVSPRDYAFPPEAGGPRDGDAALGGLDDLFPQRPLADEPRSGDWEFEITWRAQLLPPEAVRQREDAAQHDAADKAGQPAAANTADRKEGQS